MQIYISEEKYTNIYYVSYVCKICVTETCQRRMKIHKITVNIRHILDNAFQCIVLAHFCNVC